MAFADLFRGLTVTINTPEEFAKFATLTGGGIVTSEVLSASVATAAKLGGRAYHAVKLGVKIPITLLWLWLGRRMGLGADVVSPMAVGMLGTMVSDVFKMVVGVGPETYGTVLAARIESLVATARGSAQAAAAPAPAPVSVVVPPKKAAEAKPKAAGFVIAPP